MDLRKSLFFSILFLSFSGPIFSQAQTELFNVKITGNGEQALVFIPGLASSGEVFAETRPEFEKDYTCYTFTFSGFAGVPPTKNPGFETWKKAIADYLRENQIENPIIIGHSLGGALAMAIAADYPELPKKIVVIDALPNMGLLNPQNTGEETDCTEMVAQMTRMSQGQFAQSQRRQIQYMVADTTKQEMVLNWSLNSDRETVATLYCDLLTTDLREKIGKISCPTLVLLEPYFENIPAVAEQYENLKTANLEYAPTGRHFLMYGAKTWFKEQLHKFIP